MEQLALQSPYFLDRCSVNREQPEWLRAQVESDEARVLIAHGSQLLVAVYGSDEPRWATVAEVRAVLVGSVEPVYLGQVEARSYFVIVVADSAQAEQLADALGGVFEAYVSGAAMAQTQLRDVYALAAFLGFWHGRHQVCGCCGSSTRVECAGHQRRCSNEACGQLFFPNMDPAVIVLIEHGDRCLLGRLSRWRSGMYSAIAGFVEPGESLEAAVAREVQEEVGIAVEAITYHSSQSWLFPNSLMLGFTARAVDTTLTVNTDELETADWFTREQVRADPEMLPRPTSIAYRLIQDWLNQA